MEIQPSRDDELVAQDTEQFGSPDVRDTENQHPSPPDDESDIENQLSNPPNDESDIENQLPSPPDVENQLPNPPNDESNIENQLPNPPHDESDNENQLANPSDVENQFSNPPDDESVIENKIPNPPDDENHIENELSSPRDDENHIENELSSPRDDENHIENELSSPRDDENHIENELSSPRDDENHIENELSSPRDDEGDIENQLSNPTDDESGIENQLPSFTDDESDIEFQIPSLTDDESDIENQLPNPLDEENYQKACRSLRDSAFKDNWRVAEPILKKYPSIFVEKITKQGETVLHIATTARSIRFVGELMKVMEVSDLELKDNHGNTVFFYAATLGFIEIAKAMVERNTNLPNILCGNEECRMFPITAAAYTGVKAMVSYLFEVTSLDMIPQDERLMLLHFSIHNEMYEVALNIFNKDRTLANKILERNASILYTLSQKSLAISNQEVKSKTKFTSVISMARSLFITWLLPERYVLEKQAGVLLEELWAECERSSEDKLLEVVEKEGLLHSAAKSGNVEFLAVIFRSHPELIWQLDNQNRTIFHIAVLYRQEKLFSLIHQIEGQKSKLHLKYDNRGNNMLHLAGMLGYSNFNDEEKIMPPSFLRVSGAALQMQREILWFKEVEKHLPPLHNVMKNKDEKTPMELFTKEHKLLLKQGESWMKHTANSCMIVATLIATMVFAAGFTVPGGNNDDTGIPILLKLNGFRVFVISDAVALFSSIISIIMFLSILTSRYAEEDFLVSLPAKLLFGLTALFVSIVSMLLAFAATFFLVYSNHMGDWEPKLIAACAGVPVALFGCLQYKLWFDVAKSTYWSRFHFRSAKYKLY